MVTSALSAPGWRLRIASLVLLATLMLGSRASAYSVLTHEATIDAAWDTSIKPLLLARFPKTSAAALDDARAYAYGGCVIHDLGYYPFGSKFFSNLVHYVRSGDFVESLIRNATDVNEYAKAKLHQKSVDLIVANDVSRNDAGFDVDTNAVTLVSAAGNEDVPLQAKSAVAAKILDRIERLLIAVPARNNSVKA